MTGYRVWYGDDDGRGWGEDRWKGMVGDERKRVGMEVNEITSKRDGIGRKKTQ